LGEVFEDPERVVIRVEAPGMDAKDFEIEAVPGMLRLRGEKRSAREAGDGAWRLAECAYGSFERSFRLPAEASPDQARASYRRGILRIELPKARRKPVRQVKVQVH
jgi:HSP20 family protein